MTDKKKTNQEASNTIPLKHPFEFEGAMLSEVSWRRPKGRDLIQIENEMIARGITEPVNAHHTIYILARATGLQVEAIEEMDLADVLVLSEKAGDFL